MNLLRISFAHEEDDGRGVRAGIIRQGFFPAWVDEAGALDGSDVPRQTERDDVGLQAVDDRAGLFARSAVRLLDGDGFARLVLVIVGKCLVDLLVEFACGIVRHIEKLHFLCGCRAGGCR